VTAPLILVPHEPTEACGAVHCHSHHVDEPADPAYIVCFECGHVYRTARELRQEYRSAWTGFLRNAIGDASIGDQLQTAWFWLLSRFARARSITFCQHCIHDF
jgi:hypothetical protein